MSINSELVTATKKGNLEEAIRLLDSGADLHTTIGDGDKRTLLHHAAQRGNPHLIEVLIQRGIDVDVRDKWGRTPLYLSCLDSRLQSAKILVANGAKLNEGGEYDPLDIASSNSYYGVELVEFLLENGADVNQVCRGTNVTPLMGALHQEKSAALKLLLEAGANTNHIDANGGAPLGRIAVHDFPEHIRLLLDHNAKIDYQDRKGNSALHIATERENKKVIEVLIKRGINIYLKNKNGDSALDIAKRKKPETLNLITKMIEMHSTKGKKGSFLTNLKKLWK